MLTLERKLYGKKAGIYCIINNVSGKVYIGQAIDLYKRIAYHKQYLTHNKHDNSKMQYSFNKHGESAFTAEVLEVIDIDKMTDEKNIRGISIKLMEYEQFWMDFLRYAGAELYNIADASGSTLGHKYSDEAKKKLSEISIDRYNRCGPPKIPRESYEHNSSSMEGHSVLESTKKKLSDHFKNLSELEKEHRLDKSRESRNRTKDIPKQVGKSTSKRVSKYIGVTQRSNTFRAIVYHNKKTVHLGTYATAEDAAKAYDEYIISNNIDKPINNIK